MPMFSTVFDSLGAADAFDGVSVSSGSSLTAKLGINSAIPKLILTHLTINNPLEDSIRVIQGRSNAEFGSFARVCSP